MVVSQDDLWWTAGQIDGDGSVGIYAGRLKVVIKKSVKSLQTLQHIQRLFGGVLNFQAATKQTWEDQVAWILHAESARSFCSQISPYVMLKRRQFEVAAAITVGRNPAVACKDGRTVSVQNSAELLRLIHDAAISPEALRKQMARAKTTPFQLSGWTVTCAPPPTVKAATMDAAQLIKSLKQQEHAPHFGETPPAAYFCGFFEADGCVMLVGPNPRVSVTQKYRSICDLLQSTYGGGVIKVAVKNATLGHMWSWTLGSKAARLFLEAVHAHAVEKRDQMALALAANKENWLCNKRSMDELKGARKKYCKH